MLSVYVMVTLQGDQRDQEALTSHYGTFSGIEIHSKACALPD